MTIAELADAVRVRYERGTPMRLVVCGRIAAVELMESISFAVSEEPALELDELREARARHVAAMKRIWAGEAGYLGSVLGLDVAVDYTMGPDDWRIEP